MRITYEFHKDNPPKKCPEGRFIKPGGGFFAKMLKSLYQCHVSAEIIEEAAIWTQDSILGSYPIRPNRLLFLSNQCAKCALNCEVAVEVNGKQPTGNIELTYSDSEN